MTKITPDFLDDGARGIMAALQAAGEDCRAVGGCVRDVLAGRKVGDIDLATPALPEKVMQVLEIAGFQVIPVGLAFGVVMAVREGRRYEIASLREDVKTDGRHAIVAFTQDWEKDARRRDFTINAMSASADGTLYDYAGGAEDLVAGRVRFIGEADTRIQEDYLRILRFYRFHASFGGGEGDDTARAAIRAHCAGIQKLSRERVTEELGKLLSLSNPFPASRMMMADDVAAEIAPQLSDIEMLARLLAREEEYGMLPWHARLAAWGGLARRANEEFLNAFIFSRAVRGEISLMASIDLQDLRAALYHHGKSRVCAAVLLRADDANLKNAMPEIDAYAPTEFPFAAEDLLALGVTPGPRLGEILREVEKWWVNGNFLADKNACMEFARRLM